MLLRRPPSDLLNRVCSMILPGSHAERVRRLRGGIDAGMHAFDLVEPSGARRVLVLRRYREQLAARDPRVAERAWRTLLALQQLGLHAPRPVWFDGGGTVFGMPAYVMSYVPGRGNLSPRDERGWLRQLAEALAALHRTIIDGLDLSFLPSIDERLDKVLSPAGVARRAAHPDNTAMTETLRRWRPRLAPAPRVLSHGDFWAGNTLWRRGRLTAVIDWDDATIAPAGYDVGYFRTDIALLAGPHAPDLFLHCYEEASGIRVSQLFFWDLLGATHALPDPARWVAGYHDLGRMDLSVDLVRARLRAFIAGALARAAAADGI